MQLRTGGRTSAFSSTQVCIETSKKQQLLSLSRISCEATGLSSIKFKHLVSFRCKTQKWPEPDPPEHEEDEDGGRNEDISRKTMGQLAIECELRCNERVLIGKLFEFFLHLLRMHVKCLSDAVVQWSTN